MSTDITSDSLDRRAVIDLRVAREAARVRSLSRLMSDRVDLAGVHGPADFAVEAVSWGA